MLARDTTSSSKKHEREVSDESDIPPSKKSKHVPPASSKDEKNSSTAAVQQKLHVTNVSATIDLNHSTENSDADLPTDIKQIAAQLEMLCEKNASMPIQEDVFRIANKCEMSVTDYIKRCHTYLIDNNTMEKLLTPDLLIQILIYMSRYYQHTSYRITPLNFHRLFATACSLAISLIDKDVALRYNLVDILGIRSGLADLQFRYLDAIYNDLYIDHDTFNLWKANINHFEKLFINEDIDCGVLFDNFDKGIRKKIQPFDDTVYSVKKMLYNLGLGLTAGITIDTFIAAYIYFNNYLDFHLKTYQKKLDPRYIAFYLAGSLWLANYYYDSCFPKVMRDKTTDNIIFDAKEYDNHLEEFATLTHMTPSMLEEASDAIICYQPDKDLHSGIKDVHIGQATYNQYRKWLCSVSSNNTASTSTSSITTSTKTPKLSN
ncbi:hypothetical protein AYO45_01005 [Gammaproteobacteria bacterium SCGC AG-212-F23]|nr:hypothetical protein AYO45_01005 [Gammaproteobacteria bacterium SCGC AG-212-F23]